MNDKRAPLIEADLGPHNGTVRFYSIEEVVAWLAQERAAWAWVEDVARHNQEFRATNTHSKYQKAWGVIEGAIGNVKSSSDPSRMDGLVARVRDEIQAHYGRGRLLARNASRGRHIEHLRQTDAERAAYMLAASVDAFPNPIASRSVRGIVDAHLSDIGVESTVVAERAALQSVSEQYCAVRDEARAALITISAEHDAQRAEFGALRASQEKTFADALAAAKQELDNVTATYDKRLALQASVTYWARKRERHTWSAWAFAIAGVLGLSLLTWAAVEWGHAFLRAVPPSIRQSSPYFIIVLLAFAVGIPLWVVRIIARMLMNSVQLRADADERRTMLQTYLALLREGELSEDDRRLILAVLFRPGRAASPADDDMTTLVDSLRRLVATPRV